CFKILIRQIVAAMLLKEPAQNVVQKFAGVDRQQVERGFAARFELQHPVREETERAVSVCAEPARAVNMIRAEMPLEHRTQIRICDLAIVRPEPTAVALVLDLCALQRGCGNKFAKFGLSQEFGNEPCRKIARRSTARLTFPLANQNRRQFCRCRSCGKLMSIDITADLHYVEFRRCNGAPQLFNGVRRNRLSPIAQRQGSSQIESLGGATS